MGDMSGKPRFGRYYNDKEVADRRMFNDSV